jgi:nucleoid DNA-binding protein
MADFEENEVGLLPGITEYLESVDDNIPVTSAGLEELVAKVRASTGLNEESSAIIIKLFFQEIRNQILKSNTVMLKGLGKFFMSSPKINNNKKKIFPKFKPFKELIAIVNKDNK